MRNGPRAQSLVLYSTVSEIRGRGLEGCSHVHNTDWTYTEGFTWRDLKQQWLPASLNHLYLPSLITQKRSRRSSLSQLHLYKQRPSDTGRQWKHTESLMMKQDCKSYEVIWFYCWQTFTAIVHIQMIHQIFQARGRVRGWQNAPFVPSFHALPFHTHLTMLVCLVINT